MHRLELIGCFLSKRMRTPTAQCSHEGSNYPNKYIASTQRCRTFASHAPSQSTRLANNKSEAGFPKRKAAAPSGSLTVQQWVAGREIASDFHIYERLIIPQSATPISLDYQKIKTIAATQLAVNQFAWLLVIYQNNHPAERVQIGKVLSRNRVQIWQAASLIWLLRGECASITSRTMNPADIFTSRQALYLLQTFHLRRRRAGHIKTS